KKDFIPTRCPSMPKRDFFREKPENKLCSGGIQLIEKSNVRIWIVSDSGDLTWKDTEFTARAHYFAPKRLVA
ncbi:MAG TPA: hypothetical protein P5347_08015, partial [Smithellaceae bacterium]|nr:hypothetical protein [Smithellaceae bacterium]